MKRIAVLTSGGDAPGMNAAIRAVVRSGIDNGWDVYGVKYGYKGLLAGAIEQYGSRDVGGILQAGGTVLGSARCPEFETEEGQLAGIRKLNQHDIDALIVIGGNGSQSGANALSMHGFPVVGVASTIDNDLYGTAISIGVDTALNIVLEAIDRLKVTATSHQRGFLVETMGRNCGYLALMAAITGGAEAVVVPEVETSPQAVAEELLEAYKRGKPHALVVVAEGAKYNADKLVEYFRKHREELGFELRVTTLGHVQRGGMPSASDRLLATRFGVAATQQLADGNDGVLVGMKQGRVVSTPLDEVVSNEKTLDLDMLAMANVLAK